MDEIFIEDDQYIEFMVFPSLTEILDGKRKEIIKKFGA